MPSTRRDVRNAIKAVLAMDEASETRGPGFNPTLLALTQKYEVDSFAPQRFRIDWTAGSESFFFGDLGGLDRVNLSEMMGAIVMCVYTSDLQSDSEGQFESFKGVVRAHIDVYLRFHGKLDTRDTIEHDDSESIRDWVEHAVTDVLCNPAKVIDWETDYGVIFDGRYSSQRPTIEVYQDGWGAVCPMQFVFAIDK